MRLQLGTGCLHTLWVGTGAVLAAFSLTACSVGPPTDDRSVSQQAAQPGDHPAALPWIPGFVKDMSEEAEVGQLLVPSVPGRREAISLIGRYHVGGFVYSAADTRTPEKTARLSNALQEASALPLLLGIGDDKAATYLTPLPSEQELAAAGRQDASAVAHVAELESRAVGITPGYGPVNGTDELRLAGRKKQREEGPVKAVADGADQLIDPPNVARTFTDLLKAVHTGDLSQARLDEAVSRVLRLKQARGLFGDSRADPARAADIVGSDDNRSAARTVAAHAITLVKNDHVLPLTGDIIYVAGARTDKLTKALRAAGLHVTGAPNRADVIVLATEDEGRDTAAKVRTAARRKPVVLVALGKPDDLAHLGKAVAAIAAYAGDDVTLEALAKVLSGELHPTGRLPAAISPSFPAGFGLTQ